MVSKGTKRIFLAIPEQYRCEVVRAMEMERAMIRAIYTKNKEMLIKVSVKKMNEKKTAWKTLRTNEWLTLKRIFKHIVWKDVDWIHLAQVRNQ